MGGLLTAGTEAATLPFMRVAMIQFAPRFGEVDTNLDAIEAAVKDVEADLTVLPELCTTGYQFRDRDQICCHGISISQCYALEFLHQARIFLRLY